MDELFKFMEGFQHAVVISLLIIVWSMYSWIKENKSRSSKLPPGSKGWPLIGHTLSWYLSVSSSHPPSFVEGCVKRYGKIFSCKLLGRPTIISADPSFNRYILKNEGRLFRAGYPKSFRDLVGKKGLIAIHGDLHKKLHSIAINLMTSEKLAISLMANQLLGISTEEEINEMAPVFCDFVEGIISFPIKMPGFAYFKAMKARRVLISKICEIIDKRKCSPAGTKHNGLLARLLDEDNLSQEIVADFIISLLFAGHETTAKTMSFAIYFLTQCPEAVQQLRDENDSVRRNRNKEMLTWEDYKSMKFTRCVLEETLRLGGIAISVFRETIEEIEYKGHVIPKGWLVVPFFSAVHLNEDFYEDSLKFDPWRWQKIDQESKMWRTSELYMPFGAGARFCPGAELARLQITLFLHYFVTMYRWEQLKEDRTSYFPSARLVGRFPVHIQARKDY
ncbi:hypothetical protein SUGI_0712460 [Cryptomeria japonica]|nr:hypothetical protein SUGI_0712460 [Cryptomeria japonica]